MDRKLIARINELAHKSKETGLTEEEKLEQAELRKQYLTAFRKNLRASVENIELEYPDGRVVSLKEQHEKKYGKTENEE